MKSRAVYIYALTDPRNNAVRYVDQSINPEARLVQHLEDGWKANRQLGRWLDLLQRKGMAPVLKIVETCRTTEQADLQERYWIRKHTAAGADLLNICDGTGRGSTRALHVSRDEWLGLAAELQDVRETATRLERRAERMAGRSKPVTVRLTRALRELDAARVELERLLGQHYPEWNEAVAETLYQ